MPLIIKRTSKMKSSDDLRSELLKFPISKKFPDETSKCSQIFSIAPKFANSKIKSIPNHLETRLASTFFCKSDTLGRQTQMYNLRKLFPVDQRIPRTHFVRQPTYKRGIIIMHPDRFQNRFDAIIAGICFRNRKFWEMRMVSALKWSEIESRCLCV